MYLLPSLEDDDKDTENDVVLFTEPDISENAVLEAKQNKGWLQEVLKKVSCFKPIHQLEVKSLLGS